jgi:hypothetical protein
MIDPRQHFADAMNNPRLRQERAIDHDHRQTERPRRVQLRPRAFSARILGYDQVDPLRTHQGEIALQREGATIHHQMVAGQRRRHVRGIDEAEQIMMLWMGGEGRHMHSAERQHDAAWFSRQCIHGAGDVGNRSPAVAFAPFPGGAGQHDVRYARLLRRLRGMGAHGSGKGVGRVDQMRNCLPPEIGRETRDAAKAADAHGDRLRARLAGASGIAQHRAIAAIRQRLCERAGLGRAAQDEDIAHGS